MLAAKRITEAHHNVNELARSQALAGMKADELVQSFDFERRKRSLFQYSTSKTAKHSKAQTSFFVQGNSFLS